MAEVPTIQLAHLTDAQRRAYILADNKLTERGGWDQEMLNAELRDLAEMGIDLSLTGFEAGELEERLREPTDPKAKTLSERFLVPPFSILDARQAYWQQRKREWLDLGIDSEVGRGENLLKFSDTANAQGPKRRRLTFVAGDREREELDDTSRKILDTGSGTSIFDPVLCEIAYRWFCPPAGRVLDPFAGGSVRGIVASRLGHHYTGVELRPEQVEANRHQATAICRYADPMPRWIEGDAQDVQQLAAGNPYDFILSCPPYADLERYSDDPRDLSTMTYEDFREMHARIIAEACGMLADNRFAVWVVGEVRGPDGSYRGFVRDTITAFEDADLKLWNDAVLVTAIGSLPIRVGTQFIKSRKLGKTHQNALVFYKGALTEFRKEWALKPIHHNVLVFAKGDGRAATQAVGNVEVGDLEQDQPDTEAA